MNQQSVNVNKLTSKGRISSLSTDETSSLSTTNGSTSSSLQSFIDDLPFGLNPKYRRNHLTDLDIDQFDCRNMLELLSTTFDFQLENQVLLEALEDLQRKKKEIEIDSNNQSLIKNATNVPTLNELSNKMFQETRSRQSPPIPMSNLCLSTSNPRTLNPVLVHQSPSNSYRLPSVRDIYWPSLNQEQYSMSTSATLNPVRSSSPSTSIIYPMNRTSSILVQQTVTPVLTTSMSALTPTQPLTTIDPIRPTNRSNNNTNKLSTDDLTSTFDGTLTSDDPFHDAELRSLNDVAELNHLYSAIGSANNNRR